MMNKNIMIVSIIAINFLMNTVANGENYYEVKSKELKELRTIINKADARVTRTGNTRGRDWLVLLPTVSVSRRDPYSELPEGESETYVGVSLNINRAFDIANASRNRETLKRKTKRKIQSIDFTIRNLIERKYQIKEQIWKLTQIRKSMVNPLEAAQIDEKISRERIRLQETRLKIEENYAEIEYMCVEVER